MDRRYTISQLARAAGVPTSTLRYYERIGLVQPTRRAENNYRLYTKDTLQIVRFIRTAQTSGFTLDNIRTLLELQVDDATLCKDVQPLIEKRLAEVSQRIREMRSIQRLLKTFLSICQKQDQDAQCPVVESLSASVAK